MEQLQQAVFDMAQLDNAS